MIKAALVAILATYRGEGEDYWRGNRLPPLNNEDIFFFTSSKLQKIRRPVSLMRRVLYFF